jgi:hypothetical protein
MRLKKLPAFCSPDLSGMGLKELTVVNPHDQSYMRLKNLSASVHLTRLHEVEGITTVDSWDWFIFSVVTIIERNDVASCTSVEVDGREPGSIRTVSTICRRIPIHCEPTAKAKNWTGTVFGLNNYIILPLNLEFQFPLMRILSRFVE